MSEQKIGRAADIAAIEKTMNDRPPGYHEQANLANAVTSLLLTRKNGRAPGFAKTTRLRWSQTYSQTRGFPAQTAFFVPFYMQEPASPGVFRLAGHCMVLVDRVMLLYTPPQDVANYVYGAVNSGRCWIPGY